MSNISTRSMLLYAVTDRFWTGKKSLYEQVKIALQNGVTCLQYREKHLPLEERLAEAKAIASLCRKYQIPFIINDDVHLALACDADGVHLGQDDISIEEARKIIGHQKIIGMTAHNVTEALKAQLQGADYLGLGAVFPTSTKGNTIPLSLDTLKKICSQVNIPKVAIAGITASNIQKLAGTGIDGVAVVSAIFGANDIATATSELKILSEQIIHPTI